MTHIECFLSVYFRFFLFCMSKSKIYIRKRKYMKKDAFKNIGDVFFIVQKRELMPKDTKKR
jgi:hypothetical protein